MNTGRAGSVTGPAAQTTAGVDAIIASLPRSTSMVEFSMHAFLSPVITTLDRDTASGSWLMWIASVIDNAPRAVYMSADMTYTRTDAGWRIQTVDIHYGLRLPPDEQPV
jgi:hypothetical protein